MTQKITLEEAQAHLASYLDQVADRGERIVIERQGKPVAAIVRLEDLDQLEPPSAPGPRSDEKAREALYRQRMEEAGLITSWPTGDFLPPHARTRITVDGTPISEQIIADRG